LFFRESKMALFFERMRLCAQKVLDTTDIVRDAMFPPDALAKLKNESGLSTEQLQQGLTAQLSQLMGGQNSIYSVAY
jgi:hypothetical protein